MWEWEPNFLLERGDKAEKEGEGERREGEEGGGGGGSCKNGRLLLFYCFTVQSHLQCVCGKSKVSFITFQFFSLFS